jgi:Domain of unknown function (DUF4112)
MAMSNDEIFPADTAGSRKSSGTIRGARAQGPVIDQEGREIPVETLDARFQGFRFDFGNASGQAFRPLTREQRVARLDALAKLLDVAFVLPGTNIRYGIDGIIGMIPVIGDIVVTALSLWLVREARALGAPWYITARMLANVGVQGLVGIVPVAGNAFDVLFRANVRNARLLRRWLDRQAR